MAENETEDSVKGIEAAEEQLNDSQVPSDVEDSIGDEVNLDEIADITIEVLQTLLNPFDVGDITIDEYEGDDDELILDITGPDLAILIGRHGRTLDALQFITSAIVRRKLGFHYPVIVDVEGYKSRQREKIETIARSSANRAVSRNQNVSLRPMNPYERRIVHMTLKDDGRVETESAGEGSERHVVIYPL